MAVQQIPNLPAAIALTGTEQLEAVQAGTSVRITASQIANLANAASGVLQPSVGGTGTGDIFQQGSIVFAGASGVYSQSNGNLFWDNANSRLGVGTGAPSSKLQVVGNVSATTFNNVSITTPASGATLTIANGSTLSTGGNFTTGGTFSTTGNFSTGGDFSTSGNVTFSGSFNSVFTLTGGTNLTLPTTGTVTALGNTVTGSGNIVLASSPSLTTPALGAATAISLNNVAITSPVSLATLTLASGGLLQTVGDNYHIIFTATANTSLTLPISGTVTALGNTTTGSGNIVLATSPTLTTPTLGVATATSINKVAITAPATSATLTISDGKTISFPQSLSFPNSAGTNGFYLQTDGLGNLAWAAAGGGGGGGVPGGSDTQIQYNSAGSFAASPNLTWVSPTLTIGVQGTTQGKVVLANTATTYSLTLQSSNSATAAWTLTFPTTAGTTDQFLKTDGSGVTSWMTLSGLATVSPGTGVVTAAGNAVNASGGFITYSTFAPASGKVLTLSNTMTLAAGADGQTFTFPATGGNVTVLGNTSTGSGSVVLATSPSLTTPTLGVASATSINKVAITAPATSATLTIANGGTLATTGAFSITFNATALTSLDLPTSGTVTALGNSSTGSGSVVLATSPTLTTPTLGVASATSINKVAITAPATNATLTLANGSTLATSGAFSITLTSTNTTSVTLPTSGTLQTTTGSLASNTGLPLTTGVTGTLPVANGGTGITSFGTGVATWLGTPSSANLAAAVTDETGSGLLVFATSPTLTTPRLAGSSTGYTTFASANSSATNYTVTFPAETMTVGFRNIPQNSKTASYTLVADDNGKHISITTGGVTVNASVFSAGDVVTVYNNSGSNQTITQGTSVTLRLSGTATTGNRTLAQYGVATLLCITGGATPTFVVTGNVT